MRYTKQKRMTGNVVSGSPSVSGEKGCESYYTDTIGWGKNVGKNIWTPMHNKHIGVKRVLKRVITEISRRKWEHEYKLTVCDQTVLVPATYGSKRAECVVIIVGGMVVK